MIPILYESTETNFLNNGLGSLADAISCVITEERNGVFELEMEYPITGINYEEILENRIIFVRANDGTNNQPFQIYKITRPINGRVKIYGEHISYRLNKMVVMPFTATSAAEAFSKIMSNCVDTCPFNFITDKTVTGNMSSDEPRTVRELLGGTSGSILDVYGPGEYEFDRFRVYFRSRRGSDKDITLRYGKNITDITRDVDVANIYTGVVPFWKGRDTNSGVDNDDITVYLPEKVVWSPKAEQFAYKMSKVVDFSSDFENKPSDTQLRNRALNYLKDNEPWRPNENLTVSFVPLWQTDEYKNVAALERVQLCDRIKVHYDKLGVDATMKVVKTVYDALAERYTSIELGEAKSNLGKEINNVRDDIQKAETGELSYMQKAINHVTNLLVKGTGGFVVKGTNSDGEWNELYFMDTNDPNTAVNVLRINKNGIGFSSTGIDGPFHSAWTLDGTFSANYIAAGTLDANLMRAGVLRGLVGDNYWNLDTGEFRLSSSATKIDGRDLDDYISDDLLSQEKVFNALTNDGALEGIYMQNGKLYINGTYIKSGQINATLIKAGTISDNAGKNTWNLNNGNLTTKNIKCVAGDLQSVEDERGVRMWQGGLKFYYDDFINDNTDLSEAGLDPDASISLTIYGDSTTFDFTSEDGEFRFYKGGRYGISPVAELDGDGNFQCNGDVLAFGDIKGTTFYADGAKGHTGTVSIGNNRLYFVGGILTGWS